MIKYFVRTTEERTLDKSFSQIDYELLIDRNHNSGKAFIEQLLEINDYDAVLMEDDIILCKDFKNKIEKVISEHPNDVINFFTMPMQYLNEQYTSSFVYNQCTYFPKGIAKKIHDLAMRFMPNNRSQEQIMKRCLCLLRTKHYIYRPCLVQHIDNGSLMGNHVMFCRRSPYFIDYLDELGMTYEEANVLENRRKLIALMKEKFKEIDKK